MLGAPGIGKSTICLAALHDARVAERFGDRRWFVRCDGARSAQDAAVGAGRRAGGDRRRRRGRRCGRPGVRAALGAGPGVVVLDNFETPWTADPLPVEELLRAVAAIPRVGVAVTSRGTGRPAGLRWRDFAMVSPLPLADARRLFLAVAGPDAAADPRLDELLAELDGVPLAVELMAYAAQGQPDLAEVAAAVAGGADRDAGPDGRRTPGAERGGLGGGLGHRAADDPRGAAAAEPAGRAARRGGPRGPDRAAARRRAGRGGRAAATGAGLRRGRPAADTGPGPRARRRRASARRPPTWTGRSAITPSSRPPPGARSAAAAARRRRPGCRPTPATSRPCWSGPQPGGRIEELADAVYGLAEYWRFTGFTQPALAVLAGQAIEAHGTPLQQARTWSALGDLAADRSDHDGARARYEQALPLFRQAGDVVGEANCIKGLGDIALARSDHDGARARYEQALPLYRQAGDVLGEANCIRRLGDIALERSDHDGARARYEQALPLYRQAGDVLGEANCIRRLGDIALDRSDHDGARARYEQALPLYRQAGSVLGEANCIKGLGDIALARSDHDGARARYEQALPLYRQAGDVLGEANCIQGLGDIALARSDHDGARARYEQALPLYRAIPEPYSIGWALIRLARLEPAGSERTRYWQGARQEWTSIGREDLIESIKAEFE